MAHLRDLILRTIPAAIVAGALLLGSTAHATLIWANPWILNNDGTTTSYQEMPGHMASNGHQTVISATMLQSGDPIISRSSDAGRAFKQILTFSYGIPHIGARVIYNGGTDWSAFWRASDNSGTVVRSTDDGLSWGVPTNVPWTLVEDNAAGMIMRAVAESGGQTHIFVSSTGGDLWQTVTTINLSNPVHLVHAGASHWVIYGSSTLMVSQDNGATWSTGPALLFVPEEMESDHNGTVTAAAFIKPTQNYPIVRPTWMATCSSYDFGVTWTHAQTVFMGEDEYSWNPYTVNAVEDVHLMWLGGQRWAMILHIAHREVLSVIGFFQYDAYSRAHLVQSCDGGQTWSTPERIWDGIRAYYHLKRFYSTGENLVVTWQEHNGFYEPSLYKYRDLFYQSAPMPALPPGLCQPPPPPPSPPPPPVDTTLANLKGVWSPATAKVKTKKGGDVSSNIKASLLVLNSGQTETKASIVRFFLSEDTALDPEVDVELKPKKLAKLKPAKSKTCKVSIKWSANAAGQYLIAVLDLDGQITEWNEEDNVIVSPPIPEQEL